jgi:hypothetical protein
LADYLVGLAGGDGVLGVQGVDVDLGVLVLGRGWFFGIIGVFFLGVVFLAYRFVPVVG